MKNMIENYYLEKDIVVWYNTAVSFPEGVLKAHQELHVAFPMGNGRRYFGLSRPEGSLGNIVYKAAAEKVNGDSKSSFETTVIKKGNYISIMIKDFHRDVSQIGNAFQTLIHDPRIDPNGMCVEEYLGMDDVRCMVPVLG